MPVAWHPKKMVEFLRVRRWEKKNRTNIYWVMLLIYTIWAFHAFNIYNWGIFVTKTWYSSKFLRHFPSKYVLENI